MKPIGAFSPDGAPPWITFGSIAAEASDAAIATAVLRSRLTGFRWIVHVGYATPIETPIGPVVAAVRARLEAAGLWPHVVALAYGEEWYERLEAGEFARYGYPSSALTTAIPIMADWLGRQHAAIKAVADRPLVWIATRANNDRDAFGPAQWRPVPAGIDIVAIDAYTPAGGTFATHVEPVLLWAERTTDLRLVVIPQWFRATGPRQGAEWREGPPSESAEGYARILARPRWIAMWGFLWESRPYADLVGLADLPDYRAAVCRSLGVQA